MRTMGRSMTERVLREHPSLALTLIYLGLTTVGLIHDLWFYLYFRFNILDFSETSDFLLAAIRNPLVILLSMAPVALLLMFARLRHAALKKSSRYRAYSARYAKTKWNSVGLRAAIYGVFVFVYAVAFTQVYAKATSNRIKAGVGRRVAFTRTAGEPPTEQPILLGSTTKFLFFYYPARRVTEIVPVENMGTLTIDSRSHRDRLRDSVPITAIP